MIGRHARPTIGMVLALILGCGDGRAVEGRSPTGEDDPYRVYVTSPRLATPQWVGEPGVEAVVVLAIDDLGKETGKYESYLRPILDRLKKIDGRAPVSIMACRVDPQAEQLQRWLAEGVTIEVHTLDHPCPFWDKGDFAQASNTVRGGIDLLHQIPGNRPVAFRMPCCDSINSPTPRFYSEIFNTRSPGGHFLTIDSSVMQVFTPDDPALPRDRVLEAQGKERFRKYLPSKSFVNTIENYPYPYVVGRLCWEFPCVTPSDWEAQRVHGKDDPRTLEDLKAALDLTLTKQGVFTLVFHPHGWISNDKIVALIDHATRTYGNRVKFLNFREAQERIDRNLLAGHPLRGNDGQDNGVRLVDLNTDGYLDVVIGHPDKRLTRVWEPSAGRWREGSFPTDIVTATGEDAGVLTGRVGSAAVAMVRNEAVAGGWRFNGANWVSTPRLVPPEPTSIRGRDRGARLVDLGDGPRLVVANETTNVILQNERINGWQPTGGRLPDGVRFVDADGRDAGLRLADLNGDGRSDFLVSNEQGSAVYLAETSTVSWKKILSAGPGDPRGLPPFVKAGRNNGAWFKDRHLWVQNETTMGKADLVDRRSFNDLLTGTEPGPLSPEAALRSIRVAPGFRAEMVAWEPLVADPIAFDWGADGKLWVVEMGDYPLGLDGKGKPGGCVKILEDRDGDGRYDVATEFLGGLGFPTGVMPWRDGVLIACAPDILFARDTNGDNKADQTEVVFTGFVPGNQQHRVNGFDLGLDGWVYGANGDSGGTIKLPGQEEGISIRGRDFRFDPDARQFETETGQTQFGRHRDDWGRWFGNNNSIWGWHFVLSERVLKRNRGLMPVDQARHPLDLNPALFPDSRTLPRFNTPGAANKVTSANSVTPYRDDLFGPGFAASLFVSEPVHNLVRRMNLIADGPTFRAQAALDDAGREFLASFDPWFRPTMLRTGPDGALWIADMYRAVIEHPEWIPDDVEKRIDLRAGADRGHIYRVVPVDKPRRPIPRLDGRETPALVAAMDSPNGWQRDTVQRLLAHRRDPAAIEPLRVLAQSSAEPKVRVQALWTLHNLDELDPATAIKGIGNVHPQVRRAAVETGAALAEESPEVLEKLLGRVDDDDVETRFATALVLGDIDNAKAGRALGRLILRDGEIPYFHAAILSSAPPHCGTILAALFEQAGPEGPPAKWTEPMMALARGRPDQEGIKPFLEAVVTPGKDGFALWQLSAAAGIAEAADRGRSPLFGAFTGKMDPLMAAARSLAADNQAPEERRKVAVRVLGRSEDDRAVLMALLHPQVPESLQNSALLALTRRDDRRVADALLAGWKGYTPSLRSGVLDMILGRPAWTPALLSALEETCVPPAEIAPVYRRRLLELTDPALRHRAEAIFEKTAATPRNEIVAAYRPALAQPGNPKNGVVIFRKVCASCHHLEGNGVAVGPDLMTLSDASPEALLVAILDPNRAFEAKYADYTVHLRDGRVLTGLIAGESDNGLTLRRQDDRHDMILRAEIEDVVASGRSLMPEGLEKDVPPRDLADLIAYITAARAATAPGNEVRPR